MHGQNMHAQTLVQQLMNAYNRHDIDEYCSYYAEDAITRLYEEDQVLSMGMAELRALYAKRFAENPNLYLTVQSRMTLDNVVVDRMMINGFDGGITIEAIVIHEVQAGKIWRSSFIRRLVSG